jgi:hypothetical protein
MDTRRIPNLITRTNIIRLAIRSRTTRISITRMVTRNLTTSIDTPMPIRIIDLTIMDLTPAIAAVDSELEFG